MRKNAEKKQDEISDRKLSVRKTGEKMPKESGEQEEQKMHDNLILELYYRPSGFQASLSAAQGKRGRKKRRTGRITRSSIFSGNGMPVSPKIHGAASTTWVS